MCVWGGLLYTLQSRKDAPTDVVQSNSLASVRLTSKSEEEREYDEEIVEHGRRLRDASHDVVRVEHIAANKTVWDLERRHKTGQSLNVVVCSSETGQPTNTVSVSHPVFIVVTKRLF